MIVDITTERLRQIASEAKLWLRVPMSSEEMLAVINEVLARRAGYPKIQRLEEAPLYPKPTPTREERIVALERKVEHLTSIIERVHPVPGMPHFPAWPCFCQTCIEDEARRRGDIP